MIYIGIAALLMIVNRILEGVKSGAFYGKDIKSHAILSNTLRRAIDNIHTVETPLWYAQYGAMFLLLLAYSDSWLGIASALLISMGSSAAGGYHRQGFINVGSGLPFEDEKENRRSEFSDLGWWERPWYGKRRKYFAIAGIFGILIGLTLYII